MINTFVKILELLGDRLEVCVSVYVSHVYICVLMCFECVVCVLELVLCTCLCKVVLLYSCEYLYI